MRDRIELPLEVAWDRDTDASAVELHTVALFSSPYPVWLESFLFGALQLPPRNYPSLSRRRYRLRKSLCRRESISNRKGNKSKAMDRRWSCSTSNRSSSDKTIRRSSLSQRGRAIRDTDGEPNCCPDHKSNRTRNCFSNRLLS